MSEAYLLLSHGSRDPRPGIAMQKLARLLCDKLERFFPVDAASLYENLVGTACLELSPKPLHEQIVQFSQVAASFGCSCVKIIPLFLLPGVHVMEDIPSEVALSRQCLEQNTFDSPIALDLRPHLGSHPRLVSLLAQQISTQSTDALILLSHGSRRAGSNSTVEELAAALGGVAAYWSITPSLSMRVQELVAAGHQQIAILPYFLFSGGITDAIALYVEELKLQFLKEFPQENSRVRLTLAEPLGASTELANLVWDLLKK